MNWKKIVKGLLVLLLVLGPAGRVEAVPIAQAEERLGNYTGPSSGTAQDDNVKASLDLLHAKVGGGVDNIGTGNAFYVDSNVASEGAGTSWIGAKDTLDEAVDLCTNNNGDVIYVAAGHNENWTGTDTCTLDIIGVTVIGLGKGSDRPRFDYDDVDAELVIGAANVKIYNLTFMPGYAEVVHAIEVEADADGSIVDSCEFFEGETPGTDEFLDAIQLITAADDIIISNCVVTETADGADSWLDATTGIVDNLAVVGNRVWGDYDEGCISSNKACTHCYIADNVMTNLATGIAAITFSGNATGTMVNNYASSDTPGTIIDPGYMQQAGNIEADEGANLDSNTGPAWAVSAPAGTGNYPDNVESESLFSYIMGKGSTAAASTYVNTTDSLEMASDKLGAFTGDGGADDNDSVKADLDLMQVITAKIPLSDGTVSFNSTALAAIEAEAIDAIEADSLNLLMSAADGTGAFPASVANDSALAKILAMDNGGVATTADYSNATMSLEALNIDLDALITAIALVPQSGGTTSFNATALTAIEGEATDAIEADLLNLFISVADGTDPAPASVVEDSILAKIMGDDATAVATTFDNQTDSLEALGVKTEQIAGADGVATFPAAAEAANAVSIAEVLRYVQEKQLPRMELKAYADLTGYDDAVAFTVTGDVMVRVVGVVGATGITTTSGTTTLTVGTTEDVDALLPSTVMDNGDFAATDVWIDNNPEDDAQEMGTEDWVIIGGGADISLFRNVDDITAGTLTLYCWWVPLSADGDVAP